MLLAITKYFQGMLLASVQPVVLQAPQVLLHRAAPPALRPQTVVLQRAPPFLMQCLILNPVIFHKVLSVPSLQYLWTTVLSLSRESGPHNLVSPANLVRLPSITSSKSLLKMLKSSGPSRDPSSTPLATSLEEKHDPLTAIFWAWIFYPYFHSSSFPPTWLSLGDNLQIFIM